MLHGRVVRPRGQGAYGDGTAPQVLSVDESSIKHITGAKVVRFGNFLGVVAPTEYARDPGCVAAEGQVRRPAGAAGRRATSGSRCASTTARALLGRRSRSTAATSTPRSSRRRTRSARPTRRTTPAAVDRPGVLRRGRHGGRRTALHEHAERVRDARTIKTVLDKVMGSSLPREPDPPDLLRGLERLRPARRTTTRTRPRRSCRRWPASRCGCSSCAGTSTAGTTTARPR